MQESRVGSGSVQRMRIQETQKHTDPDPEHCFKCILIGCAGRPAPRHLHQVHLEPHQHPASQADIRHSPGDGHS
jgi:hypothetical protein